MNKRERQRIYAAFASIGGRDDEEPLEPKKPKQVKRPTRIEEPGTDDDFDIWNFEAPEFTETIDVSPDGTQHATRRGRQGNASAVLAQTQQMYNDRDRARKLQQEMNADVLAYKTQVQQMKQDYRLKREQIKAQQEEAKRIAEAEKRRRQEEEKRRREEEKRRQEEEKRRREEEKRRQEEEKLRKREEEKLRKLEEEARRKREAAERAVREAAAKRKHERDMHMLNNLPDMVDRLTNTRIRQAEAIMKQAQDHLRFQDARSKEYAGKINIAKEQQGERFKQDVALTFSKFGLEVPDIQLMMQPSASDLTRLSDRTRMRCYVGSRLFTGVREIIEDDVDGYIEFLNGQQIQLPGSHEGYTVRIVNIIPFVYVVHVHRFTPEFLGSHGYKTSKDPFDCCNKYIACDIQ